MAKQGSVSLVVPECFLAGTKVLTKSGRKNIEDIKVGDEVLSRSDKTGEQGYKKVTRLFRGSTKRVVHLKVRKLKRLKKARTERHAVGQRPKKKTSGGEEEGEDAGDSEGDADADSDPDSEQDLRCTEEHPFWVEGKGWVNAKDLRQGDRLLGSDGEELEVSGHEIKDEEADHYNFEVQDFHTYFVSEGEYDAPGIWVHNDCDPEDIILSLSEYGGVPRTQLDRRNEFRDFILGRSDTAGKVTNDIDWAIEQGPGYFLNFEMKANSAKQIHFNLTGVTKNGSGGSMGVYEIAEEWTGNYFRRNGVNPFIDIAPKPGEYTEWEIFIVAMADDYHGKPLLGKTRFWLDSKEVTNSVRPMLERFRRYKLADPD